MMGIYKLLSKHPNVTCMAAGHVKKGEKLSEMLTNAFLKKGSPKTSGSKTLFSLFCKSVSFTIFSPYFFAD